MASDGNNDIGTASAIAQPSYGGGGGGYDPAAAQAQQADSMRNYFAQMQAQQAQQQQWMQPPQQQSQPAAPSTSQVPAPTPGMSPGASFALGNMVRAQQSQGIAPPDWYNQLVASSPKEVYGPYGGGAMGQPQIPSGYNAFSGAGLPPANIGGSLYGGGSGGGGSDFFGGGAPVNPQTPFDARFRGNSDFRSLTGPSEDFNTRFPDAGGSNNVPQGDQPWTYRYDNPGG